MLTLNIKEVKFKLEVLQTMLTKFYLKEFVHSKINWFNQEEIYYRDSRGLYPELQIRVEITKK